MSDKHTATFKKDPMTDRRAMVSDMKGFKGGKFPKNPFKEGRGRMETDEFYHPHKGGEKK